MKRHVLKLNFYFFIDQQRKKTKEMDQFPNEMLQIILTNCDEHSLHMCKRVCSLWRSHTVYTPTKPSLLQLMSHSNFRELMTWAFQNGCPKSKKLYMICAYNNLWHVARWLRETAEVPWDYTVCNVLASTNYYAFEWALSQGCATNNKTFLFGLMNPDVRVLHMMFRIGVYVPKKIPKNIKMHIPSVTHLKFLCERLQHDQKRMQMVIKYVMSEGLVNEMQCLADAQVQIPISDRCTYLNIGGKSMKEWVIQNQRPDLINPIPYKYIMHQGSKKLLRLFRTRSDFCEKTFANTLDQGHAYTGDWLRFDMPDVWRHIRLHTAVLTYSIDTINSLEECGYDWRKHIPDMLYKSSMSTSNKEQYFRFLEDLNCKYPDVFDIQSVKARMQPLLCTPSIWLGGNFNIRGTHDRNNSPLFYADYDDWEPPKFQ